MKPFTTIYEKAEGADSVGSSGHGQVQGAGVGAEGKSVGVPEKADSKGSGELWADDPPKPPKGSSITLDGSGDHSGRDGWNSMSLADFYKVMLYSDHGRKL